jgi:hypothetical protein
MDRWYDPFEETAAAGTVGYQDSTTALLCSKVGPAFRKGRMSGFHRAPLAATERAAASMLHLDLCQAQTGYQATHGLLHITSFAHDAGVVDTHRVPCFCQWHRCLFYHQNLVDCLYSQSFTVLPENLITVRTGNKNALNSLDLKGSAQLAKGCDKMVLSAEVVRGFMAAIEHNAEPGNTALESFKEAKGGLHATAGEITAGEEYRVTTIGNFLTGEKPRSTKVLVAKNCPVGRLVEPTARHECSAQVQKKTARIELFRADRSTKTAETAFIGYCLGSGLGEIQTCGNCFGCAVMAQ